MKIVRRLKPLLLSISISLLLAGFRPAHAGGPPEPNVFVRINQLGYRPGDVKSAIAFARVPLPERFALLDAGSGRPVFNGPARLVAGRWGEFDYHAGLDFSAWQKPGKYILRIGETDSSSFECTNE